MSRNVGAGGDLGDDAAACKKIFEQIAGYAFERMRNRKQFQIGSAANGNVEMANPSVLPVEGIDVGKLFPAFENRTFR